MYVPTHDKILRKASDCVYIDQNYLRKCVKIADPIFEAELPRHVAQYLGVMPIRAVVFETVAPDFVFETLATAATSEWIALQTALFGSPVFAEAMARVRLLDEANLPMEALEKAVQKIADLKIIFVQMLATKLFHAPTGIDVTTQCETQTNAYYDASKNTVFLNHGIGLKLCKISFEAKICELMGFLCVSQSQKEAISVVLDSTPLTVHQSCLLYTSPSPRD